MSTAAAAAAESLAARMRVLLPWAAAAVVQALEALKAPDTAALVALVALKEDSAGLAGLADPEVQVAQVVPHRDLEAGKKGSQRASERALLGIVV